MRYPLCCLPSFSKASDKKSAYRTSTSGLPEGLCREFSLAEIKAATDNFHPDLIVGKGYYGFVYRGTIDDGSMVVAIKRCQPKPVQETRDYRNEIKFMCQLRHPHLVSLIGFCVEQNEMIVVYEYLRKASLFNHLYDSSKGYIQLTWKQRLQICIGAARGSHFLHSGVKHAIIHGNMNTAAIFLDDDCSCKLADFRLSKKGPHSMSNALIRIESTTVGTLGYLDPEYIETGNLTDRSDVFSFGIVLFEVLCARKAIDRTSPKKQKYILDWASEFVREGTIYHAIDPYLKGRIAPECFKKYLEIACSCVHYKGNERPTMGEVEVTLECALELQNKADAEMEAIGREGECMYEEVSFSSCVKNFGIYRNNFGSGYVRNVCPSAIL